VKTTAGYTDYCSSNAPYTDYCRPAFKAHGFRNYTARARETRFARAARTSSSITAGIPLPTPKVTCTIGSGDIYTEFAKKPILP
ncbi:MAG: hypothetical protein U9P00_03685, partial [Pseudomonadota bacterium]|nr:hypothetical protein [Pseudomonadota bacterium]